MPRAALLLIVWIAACGAGDDGGADGRELFETTCAKCHGVDGRGDPVQRIRLGVPDMTSLELQRRVSDQDIERTIREGSHSKKMPGFGTYYTDAQLDAIVAHVRRLGASIDQRR